MDDLKNRLWTDEDINSIHPLWRRKTASLKPDYHVKEGDTKNNT